MNMEISPALAQRSTRWHDWLQGNLWHQKHTAVSRRKYSAMV